MLCPSCSKCPAARAPLARPAALRSAAVHGMLQGTSAAVARWAARSPPAGAPPPGAGGPRDCGRRASSSWLWPWPPPQRPRRPPPPPPPPLLPRPPRPPRRRPAQLGARAQQSAHLGILIQHALCPHQVCAQQSAHLSIQNQVRCVSRCRTLHTEPAALLCKTAHPRQRGVYVCSSTSAL
jgi:hypothetical protein